MAISQSRPGVECPWLAGHPMAPPRRSREPSGTDPLGFLSGLWSLKCSSNRVGGKG